MACVVLIVSAEDHIRRILNFQLDKHEYATLTASGSDEALATLSIHRPDLIVVASSPDIDGAALCRTIHSDARFEDIPIIVMSPKAELQTRLEALEAGAIDFLVIPYSNEELLLRIYRILDYGDKIRSRRP
jgi:two-component system alkaline phosphatase synthesis response regulator PhoP